MLLETFTHFNDFELLDSGKGYRLERWGKYVLARPDPQAIWKRHLPETEWDKADAVFDSRWRIKNKIQEPWIITFDLSTPQMHSGHLSLPGEKIKLLARLTSFKHTGIFAEQAANWSWLCQQVGSLRLKVKSERLKILNLFAYTGAASVVLAKLGCFVTHVDASKPSITLAKENQKINNLPGDSIRWILDDAVKFVKRELKRGAKYDGIIMDPPAFGHSPTGATWKFAENFPGLLSDCVKLLSPDAKFLLINAYATNTSAIALGNILEDTISPTVKKGKTEFGELVLKQTDGRLLSTGTFARWSQK